MSVDPEFGGVIGRDFSDSEPWWPPEREPPANAPNVLLVVLDDVGFAQLGCYGSDIATPNIDRLAAGGVRFSNFHTTALCSPTRSCLLTGRNHHSNGMGRVADLASGYPGYCGRHPARQRLPLRDPPRPGIRDVRGGQVAPHPRRRDAHGGRSQLVAARSRVRPLVRVPRRRDAPVRAHALLRQPLGPAAAHDRRGLPPQRRSRRPRDRVPVRPPQRRSASSASSCTSQPARATRRTKRHPTGSRATAASSTTGGTAGASARTHASSTRGSSRRAPRCHRAPTGCPRGTTCTSPTRRSRRGSWSASPRSSRTPTTRSVACSTSSRSPAISTTR